MRATPTRPTNDFSSEFFGNKLATIEENNKYPHKHAHLAGADGADFSVNDISMNGYRKSLAFIRRIRMAIESTQLGTEKAK